MPLVPLFVVLFIPKKTNSLLDAMKNNLCQVIFAFRYALRLGQVCMCGVVAGAFLHAAGDAHRNQARREGVQIVKASMDHRIRKQRNSKNTGI